jgi:hypothetical protein
VSIKLLQSVLKKIKSVCQYHESWHRRAFAELGVERSEYHGWVAFCSFTKSRTRTWNSTWTSLETFMVLGRTTEFSKSKL